MKWTSLKIFAIKLALFSTVLAWLAVDLWWLHGPVWHALHDGTPASVPAQDLEAEVYGVPITREQLDRYICEQDWLSGSNHPDPSRRALMRLELVQETLLQLRTRYNDQQLPDCRQDAEEEIRALASRAPSEKEFDTWLHSQGYTRESYTRKLQTRLRGLALLERAIAPYIQVSDEAVAEHYHQIKDRLNLPAGRSVRHIFLSTLGKAPDEVATQGRQLLERLQHGEDFTRLAQSYSEDERTAPLGGELGMLRDDAHRSLPELPLFGDQAIPAHTPVLLQSRWGWHLVQADDIIPARQLSLDECRESLRSALISAQREIAIRAYFRDSIDEGIRQKKIRFYVK